ncbi:flavodoxin [Selenomonas sp. TAMA-11512]|uniref:flavodoxin n=1 Tax=Selenomonas sp. TAMA-11512 TaxID=3095337 RepID=UPI00308F4505|nr:flavodoxin [Selenomonas sp. TAMA-11512]
MAKVAVVYWSGTGNTEDLAKAVTAGAKKAGAEADLFSVDAFSADKMGDYDAFAFGCAAMGDEVLEEAEFEPFFAEAEQKLSGVPVVLFGSYGWGGGQWMRDWEERTKAAGAKLVADGLDVENAPDEDALAKAEALGEAVAKA